MKNLLTQWELKKKTDLKLEPRGLLLLLGFFARVAGRAFVWRCGAEPLEVKPSWVGTIAGQAIGVEPLEVEPLRVEAIGGAVSMGGEVGIKVLTSFWRCQTAIAGVAWSRSRDLLTCHDITAGPSCE